MNDMKVLINGTEYPALRDYRIEEQAGNKTSTTVSVEVGEGQPFPTAGDIIEIYDTEPYNLFIPQGAGTLRTKSGRRFLVRSDRSAERCVFYGMCGIPKSPKYRTLREKRIYTIVCGNANSILSNRVVNEAFQNYTVTAIVQALYDGYIAEENISLGAISDIDVTMEVYTAKDRNLQEALNELADLVGATWTITPGRKFSFLAEADFPVFSKTIDSGFLLGTDLQHTCRDYKTRTVQIVSGATDTTSTQTENFIYDGTHSSFTTVYPIAAKPTIKINGSTVAAAYIGVRGIDDNDSSIKFFFSFNSETVTYNTSSGALSSGNTVTVQYTGIFPVRIVRSNQTAINAVAQRTGTSGKREQIVVDTSLSSQADAQQLAESLLARFSEQSEEISLWLLSSELTKRGYNYDDFALLTAVSFDLPQIGVQGKYIITSRTVEPFDADLSGTKKITLLLTNRDYLKSHAETLSTLRRDINRLSIREDEIVVSSATVDELTAYAESTVTESSLVIPYYPVPDGSGGMFVPVPFGSDAYAYE